MYTILFITYGTATLDVIKGVQFFDLEQSAEDKSADEQQEAQCRSEAQGRAGYFAFFIPRLQIFQCYDARRSSFNFTVHPLPQIVSEVSPREISLTVETWLRTWS